ncbi:MAG: NAD(P)H-dependent oxidoreductase subunit E, partial [Ignavibacteriales bacterium]|nr:NAD(P)H-dependent oxidoreductase subunit E [Ignavibacteriales bacterium]
MADLELVKEQYKKGLEKVTRRITLCAGTGCVANGSLKVFEAFKDAIEISELSLLVEVSHESDKCGVHISGSGCQGFCQMGPLVTIEPDGILYNKVKPTDVLEIVNETLLHGKLVDRLLYKDIETGESRKGHHEIPFYNRQQRTVLKQCGSLNPSDIREYIYNDGYFAVHDVLQNYTPAEICKTIIESGLRGRGGGGFPTGRKWELTLKENNPKKYVICNGDEGDPGAFMDRSVMEGNPHSVIEGMMIAARAIGADEGIVYVRAEYPLAVIRIREAVSQAEKDGLLGANIFGTDFSFKIKVMEGAGAFVCGEETALISSVEGKRGMPAPKPPFPAQSGLNGKPTVINNVETLASIPLIIRMGAEAFRSVGTASSPGTKTFALTGHVMNTGLIEVPFGTTLREIVYEIGGGIAGSDGKKSEAAFKAVQIGGPSGGCLTQDHLDMPLDFDSLKSIGAMVGSGGLVAMNETTCMVTIARYFMQFTQNESCGKCVLCREGTKQMLSLLDDIIEGNATDDTLNLLERLAHAVQKGSLCGLGKSAPNPVLSTLRSFRGEYNEHVHDKTCKTKNCKALTA